MTDSDKGSAYTPRFRRIIADAEATARLMGHSYIGVEHLFLAILRDSDAVPTQALSDLIEPSRVASHLEALMQSPSYLGTDDD
ncbi:Clp protease N-terminal domain-containing protein [Streptomyces buecherae]|uniref:Clp protease N-terminal domain-containing protein n=1 Tax=Streptomyces buecherae TaxID=2763006 RepID=UPI0033BFF1E4